QVPAAAQLAAGELELEAAAGQPAPEPLGRLVARGWRRQAVLLRPELAAIPDDHLAGAVVAARDHALAGEVVERGVLGRDRQPLLARVGREAVRDGPGLEGAVELEAEVEVHAAGGVGLDCEAERGNVG